MRFASVELHQFKCRHRELQAVNIAPHFLCPACDANVRYYCPPNASENQRLSTWEEIHNHMEPR